VLLKAACSLQRDARSIDSVLAWVQTAYCVNQPVIRRSRAGRLWIAQLFDAMLGGFQHDMAESALVVISRQNAAAAPLIAFLREQLFQAVECGKSRLLLDQMSCGTAPIEDADRGVKASMQELKLLALTPNQLSNEAMVRREIQLSSRLSMITWQSLSVAPIEALRVQEQVDNLEALFGADEGLQGAERTAMIETVMEELREGEMIVEYAICSAESGLTAS
jgi:hypothetical protein